MAAADPYHLRRAPTIHHYSISREDLDSEIGSVEFATYTVQIPPTPDNQPMEIPAENEKKMERSFTSNSMFTGGHKCATRAHLKEKMIESQTSHPRVAGANGSFCAVPGCDAQVIADKRGVDIVPCECEYKICRDCYKDVLATGDGICPGCKEPYRSPDVPELHYRRLSFGKSSKALAKSRSGELDSSQYLFESMTNYGYGNALCPTDGVKGNDEGTSGVPKSFVENQWKPLARELKIPTKVIAPYRLLIPVRMIVLALFLHWRVSNPNEDARWLWGMSTVCEIWFAFSWLLDGGDTRPTPQITRVYGRRRRRMAQPVTLWLGD